LEWLVTGAIEDFDLVIVISVGARFGSQKSRLFA
jgi:hypothetical protein